MSTPHAGPLSQNPAWRAAFAAALTLSVGPRMAVNSLSKAAAAGASSNPPKKPGTGPLHAQQVGQEASALRRKAHTAPQLTNHARAAGQATWRKRPEARQQRWREPHLRCSTGAWLYGATAASRSPCLMPGHAVAACPSGGRAPSAGRSVAITTGWTPCRTTGGTCGRVWHK